MWYFVELDYISLQNPGYNNELSEEGKYIQVSGQLEQVIINEYM